MPAPPSVPKDLAAHLHAKKAESVKLNYLLFLPTGYEPKSKKHWPLILFLHGSGERGSDIWKVAIHGPPKGMTNLDEFPFIIVSPQRAEGYIWSNDTLLKFLDEVIGKYPVDTNRIYLTGLSMGGYGAWDLGLAFPERFAALAPVCGGGQLIGVILSAREKPEAFKSLPVWAFHGEQDDVVPVEESRRMVEALKKAGVKEVKLTVYPGVKHNSWTQTYSNPELYEWFLKHERQQKPARK
jgi:predicted peptidase